jgi:hypothetical protein
LSTNEKELSSIKKEMTRIAPNDKTQNRKDRILDSKVKPSSMTKKLLLGDGSCIEGSGRHEGGGGQLTLGVGRLGQG